MLHQSEIISDSLNPDSFSAKLLAWYDPAKRDLPWRKDYSPYAVWIAEIMLQQTTIGHVARRYESWIKRFPSIESVSEATEQEVLTEWEGLGYYSRARNIHKAAREIVSKYGGELPAQFDLLIKLPGIGRYTAGAIMVVAFDRPFPAIDVNVRRILERLSAVDEKSNEADSRVTDFLRLALNSASPRLLTEALMELGQTICLKRSPQCSGCPLRDICAGSGHDFSTIGINSKRVIQREEVAIIAVCGSSILLKKGQGRLFRSMYLLPLLPLTSEKERAVTNWMAAVGITGTVERLPFGTKHYYTTHQIYLQAILIKADRFLHQMGGNLLQIDLNSLTLYPMPTAHRKLLANYLKHQ